MTAEDSELSRREWREKHKPPITRGDPVFDLASWVIPAASIVMFLASFGGRSSRVRATPDESALIIFVCAGVISLLLVALVIRLLVKRGHAPLSVGGGVCVAVVSLLSMLVVLARNEGVLSAPIVWMFVTNAVCFVAGVLALIVTALRRPRVAPD